MPPVESSHADMPKITYESTHTDMPTRMYQNTHEQEVGLTNETDQNNGSHEDSLRGANNIGDVRGENNTCDVC